MSLRGILNDEPPVLQSASSSTSDLGYGQLDIADRSAHSATTDDENRRSLLPKEKAPSQNGGSVIDLSSDHGGREHSYSAGASVPAGSSGNHHQEAARSTPSSPYQSKSNGLGPSPVSSASAQAPCIPQKRKAAPVPIDISDDEGSTSSKTGHHPPQPASTASTQVSTPSKQEDPDSDLEITRHSQQRVHQQPTMHAEVTIDNNPVLMGQLTTVALIMSTLPEICPSDRDPSKALPPVPVFLHKDDPRLARPNSEFADRVQLFTLQGVRFGTLESRMSAVLGPVLDGAPCKAHHVRFQATLQRPPLDGPCTAILPLHILVFSTPQFYKALSDHLSNKGIFLDHPTVPYHGHERYYNPHNPAVRAEQDARRYALQSRARPLGSGYDGSSYGGFRHIGQQGMSEEAKREQVEAVFATMNSGADLERVEPNTAVIKSQLYGHQKQALAFLLDRESLKPMPQPDDGPDKQYIGLWKLERQQITRWVNVITGAQQPFHSFQQCMPPQCRGAILADDMGLGKTIVIISLIAHTLQEAADFEKDQAKLGQPDMAHVFDAVSMHNVKRQPPTEFSSLSSISGGSGPSSKKKDKGPGKRELARGEAEQRRRGRLTQRSRATLIVCPLSTVQNWEHQIGEHTVEKSTNVYVYHGSNRTSSAAALANHDVVITTYSTLGAEYSKMAKAEAIEEGDDSEEGNESEVEVINSFGGIGLPVQQQQPSKKKKAEKPKKPAKSADGSIYISPLQQIEWFRVVLDEAHMIKEHSTIQAKAACDLSAQRRIALTGTPLQNNLNDLFSLCRFIRLEPFTDKHVWTHYIGTPAKSGDKLAVSRLQLLTRHIALRRTKDTQTNQGKPILTLPSKKDEIRYLELDEQEKAFYTAHHHRYKSDFLQNAQSDSLLLKNYASILQELLRLRQICCHLALVRDSQDASNSEEDIAELIKNLGISKPRATKLLNVYRDSGAVVCCECNFEFSNKTNAEIDGDLETCGQKKAGKKKLSSAGNRTPVSGDDLLDCTPVLAITRCGHVFCKGCFTKTVSQNYPQCAAADRAACSQCKTEITPAVDVVDFTRKELADNDAAAVAAEASFSSKPHQIEHSTKVRVLMQDLLPFSQANPDSANYLPDYGVDASDYDFLSREDVDKPLKGDHVKSVVFSQWTKLLDRVADGLDECHIRYGRLDGTMSRDARTKAMDSFKNDPACEVLLVSLRAGGVGLNLTMASRVYLMEPFWNPAVENQATDRIHRLGQQRAVKLTRYIVKDSIEANMMEIQKRKMEMANLSLGQTLPKAELAARRIENLKILFG